MLILDIVSSILLIAGVFFSLSGSIGLFKFPDFFTRVHAASVTDSIAAILIIGGLLLLTSFDLNTAKLLFILIFLMITSPTASHALAKSARHGGLLTLAETHSGNASQGVNPNDEDQNGKGLKQNGLEQKDIEQKDIEQKDVEQEPRTDG